MSTLGSRGTSPAILDGAPVPIRQRTPSVSSFKDGRLFKVVSMHRVLSYNGLDQRTDVYRAAELGDSARLSSLLEAGSTTDAWGKSFFVDMHDDIDWQNEEGETALYASCFNGHNVCVTYLLNANATIDIADKAGHTALTACCFKSRLRCAQLLLLAGTDFTLASHKGKTALDWARWREAQPNADANATALRILLEDAARVGPQDAVKTCRARAKGVDPTPRHYCREYCTPRVNRDYCSPWAPAEQLSNFLTSDPDEDDDPSYQAQSPKSRGSLGA
jgi:hypothetical protein